MKLSCYFCKKYTNRAGYCEWCAWWTTRVDNKVNEVSTLVILKGNTQYRINVYPQIQATDIYFENKLVVHLNSMPFTPLNIRDKLPICIMFS